MGAATISADAIVHDLLDREPMLSALSQRWGPEVVVDGRVDRTAVGSRVFNDPDELAWLEKQVHPLVRDELVGWFSSLPTDTGIAVRFSAGTRRLVPGRNSRAKSAVCAAPARAPLSDPLITTHGTAYERREMGP